MRLSPAARPKSHLVARGESLIGSGEDKTTSETVYCDYRKVSDIAFPFRGANWAGETHTAHTTFERVTLNPKVVLGDIGAPTQRERDVSDRLQCLADGVDPLQP